MKKVVMSGLFITMAFSTLNAMEETKKSALLTFTVAKKDEDLSIYKEILLNVYPEYATKEPMKESLSRSFAILTSWIGQKGKLFIKAQDGQTPVGYLTLESLNEEGTHIAFHQSPLLPQYLNRIPEYFGHVKKEFPHAQTVYTACSDKYSKMQELIKKLGFVEDTSYVPNKELIPNPVGFVGYRKLLE